jgi:uncharacterized membrane protein
VWIVKGTLLGLWLSGFSTIGWLYISMYRHLPSVDTAVGVSAITAFTTRNPLWWTSIILCFAVCYWIARTWQAPTALWIGVVVTGLVPAGLLTLFIMLLVRMKQAARGHL